MWHSRALAVVAVAAALATAAGCVVSQSKYDRDLAAAQARTEAECLKTAAVQEKLDQANQNVKKAYDALAQKATDYTANQKAADDARQQVSNLKQDIERLKNNVKEAERNAKATAEKTEKASKDEADRLKKLQDQFEVSQEETAELRTLAEKQKAQIADLKARLEEKSSAPVKPVQPTTSAPAPAGT